MIANDTIPVCSCGGVRTRVSTQAIYRCSACGDTIRKYKGEWQTRSDKTSFSALKHEPTRHVSTPTVGLHAVPVKPHRSTRTLAYLAERVYQPRTQS